MFEGIRAQIEDAVKELYANKSFPFIWLFGFVLMTGLSSDGLWLIPGIAGFIFFFWKKLHE